MTLEELIRDGKERYRLMYVIPNRSANGVKIILEDIPDCPVAVLGKFDCNKPEYSQCYIWAIDHPDVAVVTPLLELSELAKITPAIVEEFKDVGIHVIERRMARHIGDVLHKFYARLGGAN